jgi:hypothetical protein
MKAKNFRILAKHQTENRQDKSVLFDHLELIKDAWEAAEFGPQKIIKVLLDEGVTEGLSLSNVQAFIVRARKKGLIGEKGCRRHEMDEGTVDPSPPGSEKISPSVGEHSESPTATGKKENKATARKKKPEGPGSKFAQAAGIESVPKRSSPRKKTLATLPEKGPIDDETWLAFAESQGYPLDPSGNIDVKAYAQILDQEGVEMLEDSEYNDLVGYAKSWRTHPDRNISETWAADVAQKAANLKRQMRRAVGLD